MKHLNPFNNREIDCDICEEDIQMSLEKFLKDKF